MSRAASPDTYRNVTHQAAVDGGYSGQLRVIVAESDAGEPFVFIDSDLLGQRRLVLSGTESAALSEALEKASDELIEAERQRVSAVESSL